MQVVTYGNVVPTLEQLRRCSSLCEQMLWSCSVDSGSSRSGAGALLYRKSGSYLERVRYHQSSFVLLGLERILAPGSL